MFDWVRSNDAWLWWMVALSAISFVGSLIAIPILVVRIPVDYFIRRTRRPFAWSHRRPVLRITMMAAKNALGVLFVVAGLAMLVLPGQGLITVVIGLMLMNFPGKFALERWIVRRKPVHRTLNWVRAKAARPPLRIPSAAD